MLRTLRLRRTSGRCTAYDHDSLILAWTAEIVGRVVGRSQSGVSKEWTACERRKRRNCRKASVLCGELVMLTVIEEPKDKGETRKCVGILLDLAG